MLAPKWDDRAMASTAPQDERRLASPAHGTRTFVLRQGVRIGAALPARCIALTKRRTAAGTMTAAEGGALPNRATARDAVLARLQRIQTPGNPLA